MLKRLNRGWVSDTVINHSDTGLEVSRARPEILARVFHILSDSLVLTNEIFLNVISASHFKL